MAPKKPERKAQRSLKSIRPFGVDLVDEGAINRPFLVVKNRKGAKDDQGIIVQKSAGTPTKDGKVVTETSEPAVPTFAEAFAAKVGDLTVLVEQQTADVSDDEKFALADSLRGLATVLSPQADAESSDSEADGEPEEQVPEETLAPKTPQQKLLDDLKGTKSDSTDGSEEPAADAESGTPDESEVDEEEAFYQEKLDEAVGEAVEAINVEVVV